MKVESKDPAKLDLTVTLESQHEIDALWCMLNHCAIITPLGLGYIDYCGQIEPYRSVDAEELFHKMNAAMYLVIARK
jgi:hypothetical protein